MKRKLQLVVVFALLICVIFTVSRYQLKTTAIAPANLGSAEESWRFGVVPPGAKLSHKFVLKNPYESDLVIRKISTTCACTAATPSTPRISPGTSATLDVSMAVGNQTKMFKQQVWIFATSGSETLRMAFSVFADVRPPVSIEAPEVLLRVDAYSMIGSFQLPVYNYGKADWSQLIVESTIPEVTATVTKSLEKTHTEKPRERWDVDIDFCGENEPSSMSGTLIATATEENGMQHSQKVPISVDVAMPWKVFPKRLVFALGDAKKTSQSQKIRIFTRDRIVPEDVEKIIVHGTSTFVEARCDYVGENEFELWVTVTPHTVMEDFESELTIHDKSILKGANIKIKILGRSAW